MPSAVCSRTTALAGKSEQSHFYFDWLYQQPFSISVDGKRRLVMADLPPGVERDSMMYRELKEFLKGRADVGVPEHRRLDPQLANVTPRLCEGVVSLELALVDGDYEYVTRNLVNLAHESSLFLSYY